MAEHRNPLYGAVRDTYKSVTLKHLYPSRYRAAAREPVIPGSVVFLEIREKTLSDNFRLIRAALERRNARLARKDAGSPQEPEAEDGPRSGPYTMSVICIREGMENQAAVLQNCLAAIPVLARAQFIFVNEVSYFLSALPIRPQTTVIQTWHACGAFKKFGYSTVGKGFGTTRKDLEQYPVHRNFSYVTVSGSEVVWAYAEAFHMEDRIDRILPIGVSRTDMFFSRKYREKAYGKAAWILRRLAPHFFPDKGDVYSDTEAETRESASAGALTAVPGRKIILYAPTFRGSVGRAASPDRLDIRTMRQALGKTHILLINHHPFVKEKDRPKVPEDCRDFAFDMSGRMSIEELLTVSDICITDYSSLVFEYSLFERPILFYAYDMKEYLDERGFYYPISEMMPGPVCRTTDELVSALAEPDAEFDLARVREFKYRFMSGCDGHATQRVLQLMDRASAE